MNFLTNFCLGCHLGFLSTKITESPLKNILEKNLSLLVGWAFYPLFPLGTSVHISQTFSSTIFI